MYNYILQSFVLNQKLHKIIIFYKSNCNRSAEFPSERLDTIPFKTYINSFSNVFIWFHATLMRCTAALLNNVFVHLKSYLEKVLCRCVFKEDFNLVYNTLTCFHELKSDLWTACKKPPGNLSSFVCLSLSLLPHLTQIWLIKTNVSLWKRCERKHV